MSVLFSQLLEDLPDRVLEVSRLTLVREPRTDAVDESPDPACDNARLDGDNDVDHDDVDVFLACMSGPGRVANAACAD